MNNIYVYILVMALVTYLIRALPLTLIRRHIDNRFIKSFLYYVPFVTLAVMTFPSIITATESTTSGFGVSMVFTTDPITATTIIVTTIRAR